MASSIFAVSSIYHTPSHHPFRRSSATSPSSSSSPSLPFPDKSRFIAVPRAYNNGKTGSGLGLSLVASAIATHSSVLREEAFNGLGDLRISDDEAYESERGETGLDSVDSDELAVSKLGLPDRLVDSLEKRGITHLFPIQRAVLVPVLEGRDLIARAKTGTGKTLAFGIPILKRLIEDDEKQKSSTRQSGRLPRVLVLAPTRELARQVEKEIKEPAPQLNTICVYGGVPYTEQRYALSRGVDVVVGTPGRLIDLINCGSLQLSEVQFLVLDEADQMLAVGFEEDVELILKKLPTARQSMLFSATMPGWVKTLARKYLDNPLTIDLVGEQEEKLAEGIKLYAISTTATSKQTILSDLLTVYAKGGKAIVFTQTKRDAYEVSMALRNRIASEALHGKIPQHHRERILYNFRQGKFTVLVATNVAARGLDIPNVDLVIHYDLPNDSETFVHRSGRTGRAGKEGSAILMFTHSQERTVRSFERDVGCKFEFVSPPSTDEVLESSAALPQFSGLFRPLSSRSLTTHKQLSALQGYRPTGNNYGRFSNRDHSGGRQGSSSRARGGFRSSKGDRGSDGFSDDESDGYRGRGRSSRKPNNGRGSRSSSDDWSRSSRSSSDDWLIRGTRSSRPSSTSRGDSRSFGGSCFNCGQSGHRASDCRNKQGF